MRPNPYQKYRNQQVTTATPAELVGMLYDAAIAAIRTAAQANFERRAGDVHEPLVKAQDIITELRCALSFDAGGEIAGNLDGIYGHAIKLLVEANVSRLPARFDEATALLEPLRDAWRQACLGQEPATPLAPVGHGAPEAVAARP